MSATSRTSDSDLSVTPYYHCVAWPVRRAYLCGKDPLTGNDFEHRADWFRERLLLASEVFAIDVCAYSILPDRFSLILRVDSERAAGFSDASVLRRYGKFSPQAKLARGLSAKGLAEKTAEFRARLTDMGWFMRLINEHIARSANKEEGTSGRFWQGRFKSQALLDEQALFTAISFVDLNPIRHGLTATVQGSTNTSLRQRIAEKKKPIEAAVPLVPLRGEGRAAKRKSLDIRFDQYLDALEWTSRSLGSKPKRGSDPEALLARRIDSGAWLKTMGGASFEGLTSFGTPASMQLEAERRGKRSLKGISVSVAMFPRAT